MQHLNAHYTPKPSHRHSPSSDFRLNPLPAQSHPEHNNTIHTSYIAVHPQLHPCSYVRYQSYLVVYMPEEYYLLFTLQTHRDYYTKTEMTSQPRINLKKLPANPTTTHTHRRPQATQIISPASDASWRKPMHKQLLAPYYLT